MSKALKNQREPKNNTPQTIERLRSISEEFTYVKETKDVKKALDLCEYFHKVSMAFQTLSIELQKIDFPPQEETI